MNRNTRTKQVSYPREYKLAAQRVGDVGDNEAGSEGGGRYSSRRIGTIMRS